MRLKKGEILIHPQHGPTTVTKVTSRVIQGKRRRYLLLSVHADGMAVAVPAEAIEQIGVRPAMDTARIGEVFEVLAAEGEPFDKVWSRRYKHNTERLRSGDPLQLAGLVRDVTRRDDQARISYGEASLLREARELLTAELAIALGVTPDQAVELVESAIRDRVVPVVGGDLALAG